MFNRPSDLIDYSFDGTSFIHGALRSFSTLLLSSKHDKEGLRCCTQVTCLEVYCYSVQLPVCFQPLYDPHLHAVLQVLDITCVPAMRNIETFVLAF